jgi:hypothetical protein
VIWQSQFLPALDPRRDIDNLKLGAELRKLGGILGRDGLVETVDGVREYAHRIPRNFGLDLAAGLFDLPLFFLEEMTVRDHRRPLNVERFATGRQLVHPGQ